MIRFYLLFICLALYSCNDDTTPKAEEAVVNEHDDLVPTRNAFKKVDSLSAILEKNPDNVEAYLARAEYYIENNDLNRAGIDLHNAEQVNLANARIKELKGKVYLMENKSRQAKEEWESCVKQFKESVGCRNELAKLLLAVNSYKPALELVNEAITIDNKNAESYYIKGLIVRDFYKDTTLALQYFQNAVDLDQKNIEALDMMGVMLAGRGDTLAKYYYQRVLEIDPNRADTYYKLGVYYMNRDQFNRALEYYSKTIQINPRHANAYYSMGYIHLQLREFAKARDFFSQAIRSRELNYTAFYGRGYSFEMLGDVLNARKDYRAALHANPAYVPAQEALARVNREIQN